MLVLVSAKAKQKKKANENQMCRIIDKNENHCHKSSRLMVLDTYERSSIIILVCVFSSFAKKESRSYAYMGGMGKYSLYAQNIFVSLKIFGIMLK